MNLDVRPLGPRDARAAARLVAVESRGPDDIDSAQCEPHVNRAWGWGMAGVRRPSEATEPAITRYRERVRELIDSPDLDLIPFALGVTRQLAAISQHGSLTADLEVQGGVLVALACGFQDEHEIEITVLRSLPGTRDQATSLLLVATRSLAGIGRRRVNCMPSVALDHMRPLVRDGFHWNLNHSLRHDNGLPLTEEVED